MVDIVTKGDRGSGRTMEEEEELVSGIKGSWSLPL